ncbi:hypothetical protein DFH27DRAFT_617250 [Peziza echinospora]|nr:hypothetical protein DFH27DRAFT_617250 [Peziza echinospora]
MPRKSGSLKAPHTTHDSVVFESNKQITNNNIAAAPSPTASPNFSIITLKPHILDSDSTTKNASCKETMIGLSHQRGSPQGPDIHTKPTKRDPCKITFSITVKEDNHDIKEVILVTLTWPFTTQDIKERLEQKGICGYSYFSLALLKPTAAPPNGTKSSGANQTNALHMTLGQDNADTTRVRVYDNDDWEAFASNCQLPVRGRHIIILFLHYP